MRCEDCQGSGRRFNPTLVVRPMPAIVYLGGDGKPVAGPPAPLFIPCPGCGGSGIASCCEGAAGCAADVPGQ